MLVTQRKISSALAPSAEGFGQPLSDSLDTCFRRSCCFAPSKASRDSCSSQKSRTSHRTFKVCRSMRPGWNLIGSYHADITHHFGMSVDYWCEQDQMLAVQERFKFSGREPRLLARGLVALRQYRSHITLGAWSEGIPQRGLCKGHSLPFIQCS